MTRRDEPLPACSSADPVRLINLATLFDSTLASDHAEARAICRACPLYGAACERRYERARDEAIYEGPVGTWNGKLRGAVPLNQRNCIECSECYWPTASRQRYCSNRCRRREESRRAIAKARAA